MGEKEQTFEELMAELDAEATGGKAGDASQPPKVVDLSGPADLDFDEPPSIPKTKESEPKKAEAKAAAPAAAQPAPTAVNPAQVKDDTPHEMTGTRRWRAEKRTLFWWIARRSSEASTTFPRSQTSPRASIGRWRIFLFHFDSYRADCFPSSSTHRSSMCLATCGRKRSRRLRRSRTKRGGERLQQRFSSSLPQPTLPCFTSPSFPVSKHTTQTSLVFPPQVSAFWDKATDAIRTTATAVAAGYRPTTLGTVSVLIQRSVRKPMHPGTDVAHRATRGQGYCL
eukprot:1088503-Rhodomonas_salina.1